MITRRRPPVKRFGAKTYHASQIDKINRKTPEICNQLAVSFCRKGVIWKEKSNSIRIAFPLYILFDFYAAVFTVSFSFRYFHILFY